MKREYYVQKLKEIGIKYNFEKLSDEQIYHIYLNKIEKVKEVPIYVWYIQDPETHNFIACQTYKSYLFFKKRFKTKGFKIQRGTKYEAIRN